MAPVIIAIEQQAAAAKRRVNPQLRGTACYLTVRRPQTARHGLAYSHRAPSSEDPYG